MDTEKNKNVIEALKELTDEEIDAMSESQVAEWLKKIREYDRNRPVGSSSASAS